ncbi:cytochrome P450, partial [Mycena capillaripes]
MDFLLPSAACLFSVTLIYWLNRRSASALSQIPSPPRYPIVGHALQIPTIKTWQYFEKLSHEYGPIVKVSLAGHDLIVLSDPSDAEELYGSNNLRLSMLSYGDSLKRQRAAFHQMLQPRVVGGYEEMQYTESLRLLVDLVTMPIDFYNHFLRFPASLMFTLSYGQRLNDDGKDLADGSEFFRAFVGDISPGSHLVDIFPILNRLPDFLSPWRAKAKKTHQREVEVYGRLALEVKARMGKDIAMEAFAARLWEQQEKLNLTDVGIFYIAGSAFAAGSDTNAATLLWFVMAMALYPETMKKAQQEIDTVFNSDMLPDFSRMQDLPYCFAIVKEVIRFAFVNIVIVHQADIFVARWAPAAPLSIPHYADVDDEYKGYTIPKGTTVISSIWNMHHSEELYPNSYIFNPDRFLSKTPGKVDPGDSLADGHYGFGFGRRKCPGLHMAGKSTWIAIVRVLWAFTIERRQDRAGRIMDIDPDHRTSGLTSRPEEFPVGFVPRSAAHIETIMSA